MLHSSHILVKIVPFYLKREREKTHAFALAHRSYLKKTKFQETKGEFYP